MKKTGFTHLRQTAGRALICLACCTFFSFGAQAAENVTSSSVVICSDSGERPEASASADATASVPVLTGAGAIPGASFGCTDDDTPVGDVSGDDAQADDISTGRQGESLGQFTTTGYCNCTRCCSGGFALTYSGTVPRTRHTISADLDRYPIGTRLMIDGVIYTVEDKGSHIEGNWIDIYYDNHEDAVAHGTKTQEVFAVIL